MTCFLASYEILFTAQERHINLITLNYLKRHSEISENRLLAGILQAEKRKLWRDFFLEFCEACSPE